MKRRRDVRERLAEAEKLAERYERSAEGHDATTSLACASGDMERAEKHLRLTERARKLARHHTGVAERLKPHASRANAADRVIDRLPPQPRPKPESKRERTERIRRERLHAQAEAARRKEMSAAGIDHDSRTASGKRDHEVQNLGGTKRARSLKHSSLFKNKSEATYSRVRACEIYDELWHAAHIGDYPEPRFEPKVDSSGKFGVIPMNAGAKEKLDAITKAIGAEPAALLYFRIIENWSFRAMARDGYGDERSLQFRFVAAVDAAARALGFAPESRMVQRMMEARA